MIGRCHKKIIMKKATVILIAITFIGLQVKSVQAGSVSDAKGSAMLSKSRRAKVNARDRFRGLGLTQGADSKYLANRRKRNTILLFRMFGLYQQAATLAMEQSITDFDTAADVLNEAAKVCDLFDTLAEDPSLKGFFAGGKSYNLQTARLYRQIHQQFGSYQPHVQQAMVTIFIKGQRINIRRDQAAPIIPWMNAWTSIRAGAYANVPTYMQALGKYGVDPMSLLESPTLALPLMLPLAGNKQPHEYLYENHVEGTRYDPMVKAYFRADILKTLADGFKKFEFLTDDAAGILSNVPLPAKLTAYGVLMEAVTIILDVREDAAEVYYKQKLYEISQAMESAAENERILTETIREQAQGLEKMVRRLAPTQPGLAREVGKIVAFLEESLKHHQLIEEHASEQCQLTKSSLAEHKLPEKDLLTETQKSSLKLFFQDRLRAIFKAIF